MTKQEAIVTALVRRGCTLRPDKDTRKYRVLQGKQDFFFVGKMGGLHVGPNITNSTSLTGPRSEALEAEGRRPLCRIANCPKSSTASASGMCREHELETKAQYGNQ